MKRIAPDVENGLTRSSKLEPARTALLVVDVQNSEIADDVRAEHPDYYRQVTGTVLPNIARLIAACRASGAEVIYTTIESLTKDGRDRSLDHKLSGILVKKGSWEAQVIDAVAPGDDDIVLPKTSSGVFNSTTLDYVLRNIGIDGVIVVGMLTDQCVDMAVRDGADRGYFVVCASDACATHSQTRHDHALSAFGGYCRLSTTDELVTELTSA
jgi:nicotinamidase-related amidase